MSQATLFGSVGVVGWKRVGLTCSEYANQTGLRFHMANLAESAIVTTAARFP